ncbi:hypothetical protein B0H13DRAFT_1924024 [Mycena leptocephala]|nr:hypothetical protein B0H13DRAFT_1924024 [Mycena leptocephala]
MAGDSEGLQFMSHILFVQSSPCSRIMNIHLSGGVDETGEGGTGEGAGFMPVRSAPPLKITNINKHGGVGGVVGPEESKEEEEGSEKDRAPFRASWKAPARKDHLLSKYHPILRRDLKPYGNKNTNVIELYGRITKDDTQLTYYNSGIGTYARPSWRPGSTGDKSWTTKSIWR